MADRDTFSSAPTSNPNAACDAGGLPENCGRDSRGRFTKGNRGGPGNPFARQLAWLRKSFVSASCHEDVQRLYHRLMAQAQLGDLVAAKLVLQYLLGKVAEPVNPDTLDQEECQMYLQNPTAADLQDVATRRAPAELTAGLMRATNIAHVERARKVFQPTLDDQDLNSQPAPVADEADAPTGEPVAPTGEPVAPTGESVAPIGELVAPTGEPVASAAGAHPISAPVAPTEGTPACTSPPGPHGPGSPRLLGSPRRQASPRIQVATSPMTRRRHQTAETAITGLFRGRHQTVKTVLARRHASARQRRQHAIARHQTALTGAPRKGGDLQWVQVPPGRGRFSR